MSGKRRKIPFGPGVLVAAAFIGPGTVTIASKAGAAYGYGLLWAVLFAVVAAIVLQEMAGRLGIVTGAGLSRAIHNGFKNAALRWSVLLLVISAILIGNAAYQTGNLLGAAVGLNVLTGVSQQVWLLVIATLALVIIWIGRFSVLQAGLTALVVTMSIVFVSAAVSSKPAASDVLSGFVPNVPSGGWLIVIGLIGTTVVPYNLFLHANAAAEKWKLTTIEAETRRSIFESRIDTILSVALGGLVTAAILVTGSMAFNGGGYDLKSIADVAKQLKPAVGNWAQAVFAIGLAAAGLTSAITAPIAAGYAAAGCFGWPAELGNIKLKLTATLVVVVGVVCGLAFGETPVQTIIFAQVANGIILPLIAVFLLISLNRVEIMKQFCNSTLGNVLAAVVVLITIAIASKSLYSAFLKIQQQLAG